MLFLERNFLNTFYTLYTTNICYIGIFIYVVYCLYKFDASKSSSPALIVGNRGYNIGFENSSYLLYFEVENSIHN